MKSIKYFVKVVLILVLGFFLGNAIRQTYLPKPINEVPIIEQVLGGVGSIVDTNRIEPLVDELPLENGGKIILELDEDKKSILMTYEDFEYLSKKRTRVKKTVKDLNALYERLKDK